jgi:hypothetical protein
MRLQAWGIRQRRSAIARATVRGTNRIPGELVASARPDKYPLKIRQLPGRRNKTYQRACHLIGLGDSLVVPNFMS